MAPVQENEDNTSCPVGASKRLECQVIGLPRPSVRWYKDGVNITANSRYKFEYTPAGFVVLVLENVTVKDQGVYSCRAQNSEGSAETAAQLYIKGKYHIDVITRVCVVSLHHFNPLLVFFPSSCSHRFTCVLQNSLEQLIEHLCFHFWSAWTEINNIRNLHCLRIFCLQFLNINSDENSLISTSMR